MKIGKNVKIGENVRISAAGAIEDGVVIGDNVILEGRLVIKKNTRIDHGCVVRGRVRIGENNWIYPYCVIGTGPQHVLFKEKNPEDSLKKFGAIEIGDENTIREFSSIHMPIKKKTKIGSNNYIMAQCHVAHDVQIGDSVTMANLTTLSGHCIVEEYANIGIGVMVHQFTRIDRYSMIGAGNTIVKDVPPFALINRGQFTKINKVGLERQGVTKSDIKGIEKMYEKFPNMEDSKKWYQKETSAFIKRSTRDMYYPKFEARS